MGLEELVKSKHKNISEEYLYFLMEFALHGLAEYSLLSKHRLARGNSFKDLLSSMLNMEESGNDDDNYNF